MTVTKVTQAELSLSKTVDANGWTIYDYGTFKQYKKRITFAQTIGGAVALSTSSSNLPTGFSTITGYFFDYKHTVVGQAFDLSIVAEMGTAATALNWTTRTISGGNIAYNGFIDVTLTQA